MPFLDLFVQEERIEERKKNKILKLESENDFLRKNIARCVFLKAEKGERGREREMTRSKSSCENEKQFPGTAHTKRFS